MRVGGKRSCLGLREGAIGPAGDDSFLTFEKACFCGDGRKEMAMIKGISHIGIGVKNLEETKEFFQKQFSLTCSETESFGELRFCFIPFGDTRIELLESTTPEGVIRKFIDKKGEGIHHISFEVDDIEAEMAALKAKGVEFVSPKPYPNAHKDLVVFMHPKSTKGVLMELIQYTHKK
jgi:methylmalonyl-CoA/ethylmalonyl-CoA epimerase